MYTGMQKAPVKHTHTLHDDYTLGPLQTLLARLSLTPFHKDAGNFSQLVSRGNRDLAKKRLHCFRRMNHCGKSSTVMGVNASPNKKKKKRGEFSKAMCKTF